MVPTRTLHKVLSKSVDNFLSNVVHKQTNKQTDRQANATKNVTSFCQGGNDLQNVNSAGNSRWALVLER